MIRLTNHPLPYCCISTSPARQSLSSSLRYKLLQQLLVSQYPVRSFLPSRAWDTQLGELAFGRYLARHYPATRRLPSGHTAVFGRYRVRPTDYAGAGFDRGHLCPSADRTSSAADNSATFLMSNMIPQAPNLNRNTWENLESYFGCNSRFGPKVR
jgi:hypothetical protein